jgi:hypothetical protein
MQSPARASVQKDTWTSLWAVALISLALQLALCQFFSFGLQVPISIDVNPSNLWKLAYHFPPTGSFQVLNWLGLPYLPQPLNPFSLAAANLSVWWFFTAYAPIVSTLALLAMAAFLRELELTRPAALFGGVVYAWQGDLLPFIYPGHYAYITTWPFFAIAAWAALRAQRTRYWPYALIGGACCGLMVGLQPDRGGIASLLIAALYIAPVFLRPPTGNARDYLLNLRLLGLCVATAIVIALAPVLALFQSNIVGVEMGGASNREQTYDLVTQFSLGPAETLTYLVPGFFGWHINSDNGPYWGWIGEWPGWPRDHQGTRNLNLAISTTGTMPTVLALLGACLLLPGRLLGPDRFNARQRFFGRILLALGFITLLLSWGWHTGLYRPLFALPLMDKWRNPLKWLEMTNFAFVVLSAMGLQHLQASLDTVSPEIKSVRRPLVWFLLSFLVLLILGLLLSYPGAIVLAAHLQADGYYPPAIGNIMSTLHTSLLVAVVVMGLGCLLLFALWRPEKLRGGTLENPWLHAMWQQGLETRSLSLTLALGMIVLAIAQLGWVATQFIVPWPLDSLTDVNPMLQQLQSEGDRVRVSVATEDNILDTLLENQFAALDISSLDISAASRIPDDLTAFHTALDNNRPRLWFLAGVKNVAVPQQNLTDLRSDPAIAAAIDHANGYTIGPSSSPDLPTHALVTLKDYLAKATFVPSADYFHTDEEILKKLNDPAWNPRASILLSGPPTVSTASPAASSATVDNLNLKIYNPTEIAIDVTSKQGGYILINDHYDPDWHVQINGHTAPLLRADYILRAIAIPPGSSSIVLHYSAHYHIAGLNLPADVMGNLSDGAMLAAWITAWITLRRKKTPASR